MPDDLDRLLPALGDVACRVSVRLGTATISVRECLSLEPAAIVRLDQHAGDDVDVQVHGSVIARGEVEIVEHKSLVRLTRFVPPASDEEPS